MKFLIHGINFAPEQTGIGKYTGEMVEWLVAQGHEVRVVTAPPYYPAWKVGAGHSAWRYRIEDYKGSKVWRCPLWVPAKPGGAARVLHLLSFALFALPVMLRQIFWKPDMVWVCAPAFACTPGALITAKLSGARSWLHVQDYELDVAFDMGLLRGKTVRKVVMGIERWLLRRFDVVSSISNRMVSLAKEKGVAEAKTALFPNWVDIHAITPMTTRSSYRDELGISDNTVVALFSGTLGAKQGLHLIWEAAKTLGDSCPNLVFVICGNGVMSQELDEQTKNLANVKRLPLQPKERMRDLMGMADIHLLPQDPEVADLVMPSKLTSMLSSGRAVVSSAKPGSEVAQVISQCGLLSAPGDASAFAGAVATLSQNAGLRSSLGMASRLLAEKGLSTDAVLAQFEHRCQMLAGVAQPSPIVGINS